MGSQPTYRSFFSLFNLRANKCKPFYEVNLCNASSKVGKALGEHVPFVFPDGASGWQEELLFVAGRELAWTANFVEKIECGYKVRRDKFSVADVELLVRIVKALGVTWGRSDFFCNGTLQKHMCKSLLFLTF